MGVQFALQPGGSVRLEPRREAPAKSQRSSSQGTYQDDQLRPRESDAGGTLFFWGGLVLLLIRRSKKNAAGRRGKARSGRRTEWRQIFGAGSTIGGFQNGFGEALQRFCVRFGEGVGVRRKNFNQAYGFVSSANGNGEDGSNA